MGSYGFAAQDANHSNRPLVVRIHHQRDTCTARRADRKLGPCDYDETTRPPAESQTTTDAINGAGVISLYNTRQNHYFVAIHSSGAQAINNSRDGNGADFPDGDPEYTVGMDFYL